MGFIGLLLGGLLSYFASRKGYNGVLCFFGGGLLGLIVMAFLPAVNDIGIDGEERDRRARTGNIIGGVLTALSVTLTVISVLVALSAHR